MKETRTIKVHLDTYRLLKILAAENGEKLVELIERLAQTERARENRNVADNVASELSDDPSTAV